jgi:hypothetical protein
MNDSAGWYINKKYEKIKLCSALEAIQFGLSYFEDDVFGLYEFLLEWSHGTIEELQAEFDEWKRNRSTVQEGK